MGDEIFKLTRTIRSSENILVCRLVQGKVTYVHQRLWPAIVRLQASIGKENLGAIQEIHTSSGKHQVSVTPFLDWVPVSAKRRAERLTISEATSQLGEWFEASFEDR
ncbi:MAG: hypothetical protein O6768_05410 [Planctomycetota bacterium]|nr:hypothetical protein [Planctomycetota bacterium]